MFGVAVQKSQSTLRKDAGCSISRSLLIGNGCEKMPVLRKNAIWASAFKLRGQEITILWFKNMSRILCRCPFSRTNLRNNSGTYWWMRHNVWPWFQFLKRCICWYPLNLLWQQTLEDCWLDKTRNFRTSLLALGNCFGIFIFLCRLLLQHFVKQTTD